MEEVEVDALLAHPLSPSGEHVDDATAQRYAADFDDLPPVVAFRTPEGLLLVDGYHRCRAARLLGRRMISVEVHEGTLREALAFTVALEAARTGADPAAIRDRILHRKEDPRRP
jgi:hypothetical protein